jgi:hypothetical protein
VSSERAELEELIAELPDDQVPGLLADLRRRVRRQATDRPWPPRFFGMGVAKDGRTDISANVDSYLAEGFGQSRS